MLLLKRVVDVGDGVDVDVDVLDDEAVSDDVDDEGVGVLFQLVAGIGAVEVECDPGHFSITPRKFLKQT